MPFMMIRLVINTPFSNQSLIILTRSYFNAHVTKHNSNYENTPVLSLQFSNQPLSGRLRKATARPQRKGKRLAWSNEDLRMLLRFVIVACVKARKSSKLTLLRSVCGYGCCNFSNLQISLSKILKIHTTTCTTQKYVSFLGTIFNCNFN